MSKYNFTITEDNGGGINLAVFTYNSDGTTTPIYIHGGYQFNPHQVAEDVVNLLSGREDPADWDGNELEGDLADVSAEQIHDEYICPPEEAGANDVIAGGFIVLSAFDPDDEDRFYRVERTAVFTYPSVAGAAGREVLSHF